MPSTETTQPDSPPQRASLLRSLGPAIIVASVVLGPGSILAASKVGWQYGYSMTWVLGLASLLMVGLTAMSARLGVNLDGTLCEELASRAGRPVAVTAGVTLFLVAACFQFSNNLGVLFGLEPMLEQAGWQESQQLTIGVLLTVNLCVILAMYGLRNLYQPVERLMKLLVAVMIVGFAANLLWSLVAVLAGQLKFPQEPPARSHGGDPLLPVQALIGTTFSVGGAFYQSYLVRQKGWTRANLKQGLVDSVCGISMLGLITLMIMLTAALVLYPNPNVTKLDNAADVAKQLGPLFGSGATLLFCLGIFAGAFSSFLVNAMIGGTILSDGLGLGGSMDGRWPRTFTVLALLVGMGVALSIKSVGMKTGNLIIFAQALTVIGNPLLAGAMLWLATRKDQSGERRVPTWMKTLAWIGFGVVLFLAVRTVGGIYEKLAG